MTKYVLLMLLLATTVTAQETGFREDFESLDMWEEFFFDKIPEHTFYDITDIDGESVLSAVSEASASGLQHSAVFNVYETPMVSWRWRAENILEKGDAERRSGDDYPIRIYIVFHYNENFVPMGEKWLYELGRRRFGEYPPLASLNYIWANREHDSAVLVNTYTDKAMMFTVDTGTENTGRWREHSRNILADYREAFAADPPPLASVFIMSDTDNTGESAKAFIDYIEIAPAASP